ncbi:hypothetical protein C4J91_4198 [Pseudomonas sp. R3-52-08]|nr:hypothetical protein C4J91_4198 [Pseudomonas sp. R3-52-08]
MVVTRPYKLPSYARLPLWPAPRGASRVSEKTFIGGLLQKLPKVFIKTTGI